MKAGTNQIVLVILEAQELLPLVNSEDEGAHIPVVHDNVNHLRRLEE